MIIANNQGGTRSFTMGGADAKQVRIPAVMISQNDGAALKGLGRAERDRAQAPDHSRSRSTATLDADIVFHEYGHGLTWRMIGGMSGPLAGAIGEGAAM